MYTIERHVNVNPPKDYWLPMAFQDAALLHAFLFCADGHGTIAKGKKEGPAAVVHLRKAIQIVNERLSAPVPSVTDATIAVVCTFAHTEVRRRHIPSILLQSIFLTHSVLDIEWQL